MLYIYLICSKLQIFRIMQFIDSEYLYRIELLENIKIAFFIRREYIRNS